MAPFKIYADMGELKTTHDKPRESWGPSQA
jgi:hypothetical protein